MQYDMCNRNDLSDTSLVFGSHIVLLLGCLNYQRRQKSFSLMVRLSLFPIFSLVAFYRLVFHLLFCAFGMEIGSEYVNMSQRMKDNEEIHF